MWPRRDATCTWFRLGPRDFPKPYINILLEKAKGSKSESRLLPGVVSSSAVAQHPPRDRCPSGSVPKGVVLEGRWRGL